MYTAIVRHAMHLLSQNYIKKVQETMEGRKTMDESQAMDVNHPIHAEDPDYTGSFPIKETYLFYTMLKWESQSTYP